MVTAIIGTHCAHLALTLYMVEDGYTWTFPIRTRTTKIPKSGFQLFHQKDWSGTTNKDRSSECDKILQEKHTKQLRYSPSHHNRKQHLVLQ